MRHGQAVGPTFAVVALAAASAAFAGSDWGPMSITTAPGGTKVPTNFADEIRLHAYGTNQALQKDLICLDTDRNRQVAFVKGETLEKDAGKDNWVIIPVKTSPPAVWAGALGYDPVNKEVILATGTFSPVGHSDGTWLYSTKDRDWRRLDPGSAEVKAARHGREGQRRPRPAPLDDLEVPGVAGHRAEVGC